MQIADVNEMKRLQEERANEEEGETSVGVGFANISDKKVSCSSFFFFFLGRM